MKAPLQLLPLAALLALPATLRAQNELSNFTATGRGGVVNTFASDYQAIGINPANLGRQMTHKATFTILEVGAGISSRSLDKTLFKKLIYNSSDPIPAGTGGQPSPERMALVTGLTGENVLNVNADVTAFGLAIRLPEGYGSIAISNRYRVAGRVDMSATAADIIVNGKNAAIYSPATYNASTAPMVSAALAGTNIQSSVTSEYNISYGLPIVNQELFKMTAGLGYRYINGIGIADIRIQDGTFFGYTALSPVFKIDYGTLSTNANFNATTGSGLKSVGSGHGFDVGLAAEVGKSVRLSAAVTDMGSMTWTGNVLTAYDQKLRQTNSNGITTYDVFEELANQFDNDSRSLFTYEANKEHNGGLPTKLRTGIGYRLSDLFEAGLDVTVPLNKVAGNFPSTFIGVGVDYKPVNWLRLSSGVGNGAGYGTNLPLGITLVTNSWEAGISSRNVLGYFSDSSPYLSVGFGFLRFKIGSED